MKYYSTRDINKEHANNASCVIKQGLAHDGGLFVPETIPALSQDDIKSLCNMSYPQRAAFVLSLYLTDYTSAELLSAAEKAYSYPRFPKGNPAPIVKAGDLNILELWHGPTCAFKDMALQLMPSLLSMALVKTSEAQTAHILVATSGDTGKAALEGFADAENIKITVYYPEDGVSEVQKRQMATQEGNNVDVVAVVGNFDDAQNGVKALFSDEDLRNTLSQKGIFLSSANSINWGRLVPQIVYYISAYCDLVASGEIALGETLDVTVPTGNFGNILACLYAKRMGLPIGRLICASNQNKVLTDFINTGIYDRRREFYTTVSPSMDILISSNLERLIYLTCGAEKCREYMRQLRENGFYEIDKETLSLIQNEFVGFYCDEQNTAETINKTHNDYSYLCDTHTAVGIYCAEQYKKQNGGSTKMLVASTASPYKFAPAVLSSLDKNLHINGFEAIDKLFAMTGMPVPENLSGLLNKPCRFTKVIEPSQMKSTLYSD